MNILFFTTAIEHTTFRKTAKMLQKEGAKVKMLGFTRNNFPSSAKSDLDIQSFGSISHGNYISRIIKLLKIIPSFLREATEADVIYNFTLDTLVISKLFLFFRKKVWVYQIQDIRAVYFGESLKSKLFRKLENYFINRVDLVVVSSHNYYTDFFKKHYNLSKKKVLIIENKLTSPVDIIDEKEEIVNNKITIGYFGVMRCKRSWEILKEFVKENKDKANLYLRGKPNAIPDIESQLKSIENISFGGLYRSPEDLNDIYNEVDVVWAAYPYSEKYDGNWRYARTIRFYEALAFGKPVIVQKGTPQEKDVLENNIGLVIDMSEFNESKKMLDSITTDDIKKWKTNIEALPTSYYYHKNEYKELLTTLEKKI